MATTIERRTLEVPDISCSGCVATVEKAVSALAGVEQVAADEQTKVVTVSFDPDQISLDVIRDRLSGVGYPPRT